MLAYPLMTRLPMPFRMAGLLTTKVGRQCETTDEVGEKENREGYHAEISESKVLESSRVPGKRLLIIVCLSHLFERWLRLSFETEHVPCHLLQCYSHHQRSELWKVLPPFAEIAHCYTSTP